MIVVKYQGKIESLRLIEEFEDHVMRTAAALGSRVSLWRSSAKDVPGRLVRGLSLHLCPGQEAVSLLLSPEGLLIPAQAADEAILTTLPQPPWCEVCTHCGGVDGHSALIDLLGVMKEWWFPDLVVSDVTGYWEHRDPRLLQQSFVELSAELNPRYTAAVGIWPVSDTVDESLTLVRHLDRLARLMHGSGTTEEPEQVPTRDAFLRMSLEEAVLWADFALRQQERRSDRMRRIIEECVAVGMTAEEAAETALRREGRSPDLSDQFGDDLLTGLESDVQSMDSPSACFGESDLLPDSHPSDEPADGWEQGDSPGDGASVLRGLLDDGASRLLIAARELMMDVIPQTCRISNQSGYLGVLHQGLLELVGGLSQETGDGGTVSADRYEMSFSIVHLRRALKGAAYVTGALAGMRCQRLLAPDLAQKWSEKIAEITRETQTRLHELWQFAADE
ncbi:MAG: hypothetical protein RL215_2100 [Planctomycetota bacterium]